MFSMQKVLLLFGAAYWFCVFLFSCRFCCFLFFCFFIIISSLRICDLRKYEQTQRDSNFVYIPFLCFRNANERTSEWCVGYEKKFQVIVFLIVLLYVTNKVLLRKYDYRRLTELVSPGYTLPIIFWAVSQRCHCFLWANKSVQSKLFC